MLSSVLRLAALCLLGVSAACVGSEQSAPPPRIVLERADGADRWRATYELGAETVVFDVSRLMSAVPVTLDLTTWYAGQTLVVLLSVAALAVFGFYTSTAGRPLFGDRLLEGSGP